MILHFTSMPIMLAPSPVQGIDFMHPSSPFIADSGSFSFIGPPANPLGNQFAGSFRPSLAVIIGLLSTVFSFAFLLLLYAKHCKRSTGSMFAPSGMSPSSPPRPPPLVRTRNSGVDPTIVEALPIFSFGSLQGMKEGLECVVCLCRFEDTEALRLLPKCKHAFHIDCIDTWLNNHSTCPLCRHRVDAEDLLLMEEFMTDLFKWEKDVTRNSATELRTSMDIEVERALKLFVQRESENGEPSYIRQLGSQDGSGSGRREHIESGIGGNINSKDGVRGGRLGEIKTIGNWRKDALLQADSLADENHLTRRFGHRIIVSEVLLQHRWSDFLPSDVLFLNSNTILFGVDRPSLSELKSPRFSATEGEPPRQSTMEAPHYSFSRYSEAPRTPTSRNDTLFSTFSKDTEMGFRPGHQDKISKSKIGAEGNGIIFDRQPNFLKRALAIGLTGKNQRLPSSYQRSYSEITGLPRFAESQKNQLGAFQEVNYRDEKTNKWFFIARRTLNWIMGREMKPKRPIGSRKKSQDS